MKLVRPISRYFTTFSNTQNKSPNPLIIELYHARYIKTCQQTNSDTMWQIIKHYSEQSCTKALVAFNEIDNPTLPIFNYMIRSMSKSEQPNLALNMFDKMREQGLHGNNLTFIFLCNAIGKSLDFMYGIRVHVNVLKLGFGTYLYVCNAMIHMYGCFGDLWSARKMFEEMEDKDLVSWNSLICGYSHERKYDEVLRLFGLMKVEGVTGDKVTMVKVVLACGCLGDWKLVDSMVEYIEDNCVEIDVYLGTTLIDSYAERGLVSSAWRVFDRMRTKNIVTWNALLKGVTKSGDLMSANRLFDEMPERDVVSWTCMITAYAKVNQYNDVIRIFREMMVARIDPDEVTVASVLSACAHLGTLDVGMSVHEFIRENGVKVDIFVENALIDMYCKCGSVGKALIVFKNLKSKDSVSWTSIICGLAVNGESNCALDLFSQMQLENVRPIHGTFLGILLACVHTGLVDKGVEFFQSMEKDYGLVPEMRHYGCVVDLFCRAGYLSRAYEFILEMPILPDAVVWRMLLSGCNVHGDMGLAKTASDMLLRLDPSDGGSYALSSNVYAKSERWIDASEMRERGDEGAIVKPLGWSSVESNHEIFIKPL